MRRLLLLALIVLPACRTVEPARPDLRLNHLQAEGTHNSYHRRPPAMLHESWDYEMPALPKQLEDGVRQVELDVHYEKARGWTVYHVPLVDSRATCAMLKHCLVAMRTWSDANPRHHTLFVFLEPKDEFDPDKIVGRYEELEHLILSVWPRSRILTPDDVRGDHPTLRGAVLERGWPSLEATRNRAVFVMLDSGIHRAQYTEGRPSLEGRVMFVTSSEERPDAAILKIDDPLQQQDRLLAAVSAGFIVRTRADAGGSEPRQNDRRRFEAALSAGAHLISTDFPLRVPEREYWIDIPGGSPSRPNPITAPRGVTSADIEDRSGR